MIIIAANRIIGFSYLLSVTKQMKEQAFFNMAMIKHRVFLKIQKTLAQNYQIVNIYYGVFEIKHFSIVLHVAHLKLAN